MSWDDFFGFERMVTPLIIRIVYVIALVVVVLGGILSMCGGVIGGIMNQEYGRAVVALIGGPIGIVLGVLLVRVYAELLILAFRIYETLNSIEEWLKKHKG